MKYFFRRIELFVVDKFIPFWVNMLNTIRKITMLATFFCCVFVLTMIHLNLKLQD